MIRTADTTDVSFLLSGTLALHHHEQVKSVNLHSDFKDNMQKWIHHSINNPNQLCLVFEENNDSLGFLIGEVTIAGDGLVINPLVGKVLVLWVNEEHRKQGVAKRLVSEFQASCQVLGVGSLECQHTPNNQQAMHFWQNMGFEVIAYQCQKVLPEANSSQSSEQRNASLAKMQA